MQNLLQKEKLLILAILAILRVLGRMERMEPRATVNLISHLENPVSLVLVAHQAKVVEEEGVVVVMVYPLHPPSAKSDYPVTLHTDFVFILMQIKAPILNRRFSKNSAA
jgi:hypothetical protein